MCGCFVSFARHGGVNSTSVMQAKVQLTLEGEWFPASGVGAWRAGGALEVSTGVWFLRWGAKFRDLELFETEGVGFGGDTLGDKGEVPGGQGGPSMCSGGDVLGCLFGARGW